MAKQSSGLALRRKIFRNRPPGLRIAFREHAGNGEHGASTGRKPYPQVFENWEGMKAEDLDKIPHYIDASDGSMWAIPPNTFHPSMTFVRVSDVIVLIDETKEVSDAS